MAFESSNTHRQPRIGGRGSVTFDEDSILHDSINKLNNNNSNSLSSTASTSAAVPTDNQNTANNSTTDNIHKYTEEQEFHHLHNNPSLSAVPSPPRNPRMTRAMRSLAMHGMGTNTSMNPNDHSSFASSATFEGNDNTFSSSYYPSSSSSNLYDPNPYGTEFPKPRATSGSEIGLELDPHTTKVIEVYGFVGWISTFLAYIGYLLWAYLPESLLHEIGVSYYPNKYWALAAPAMLVLTVCSYSTIYGSIGLFVNPHLNSYETLDDHYSKPFSLTSSSSTTTSVTNRGHSSLRDRKGSHGSKSPHKLRSRAGTHTNSTLGTGGAGATVTDHSSSHTCTDCGTALDHPKHILPYPSSKDSSSSPVHSGTPSIQSPLRGPGVRAALGVAPVATVIPSYHNTSPNVSRSNSNLYPTLRSGYPILELNIDQTMPTPDIADVPITLINRLQFGYRTLKYQKFRIVQE